jgi:transcriptional regulator with PAS, ATPase and Fis domain
MEHERAHSAQGTPAASKAAEPSTNAQSEQSRHVVSVGAEPLELLLRAYDALDQGILVVSHAGLISYYNTAYAQLRNIALKSLIGQPLETIDRRGDLRALLRSGKLPPTKSAAYELRQNRETLLPLVDQGRLVGGMVLVTPVGDRHVIRGVSRRTQVAKSPWMAQYAMTDIIGHGPALMYARELAMKAAQGNSSVLLLGESGTGKELFAHAIHMESPRYAQPLVPVDCSAISRELLEAELFGYAPGAFTGATKEGKPGKFELADGGTVFLDEIGEMPLEMQAKLLRVLQERRVVRVGGTSPTPVDFRVIAATNRDLDSMVAEKRFRQDLLYRLDVIRIEIPA